MIGTPDTPLSGDAFKHVSAAIAQGVPLDVALAKADVVFLGACHAEYKHLRLRQPVIDVFDFLPKQKAAVRKAA